MYPLPGQSTRDLYAEIATLRQELAHRIAVVEAANRVVQLVDELVAERDRLREAAKRVVQLYDYGAGEMAVGAAIVELRKALTEVAP